MFDRPLVRRPLVRPAEVIEKKRIVRKDHPHLGITEHPLSNFRRVVVLINYSPEHMSAPVKLAAGWRISEILCGAKPENDIVLLPPNDATVWMIAK